MKKHISIIAAAILTAACTTQSKYIKSLPDTQSNKLTLKPHIFTYNPDKYNRINLTISKIEQTYFITDENITSWYYTVYAIDSENNLYCICDDLEIDNIAGYEYMLIPGDNVMLIYEKGKPDCTGEILSLNDWGN